MANIDIYLKLDGIPGDSTAQRHAGEIVVLSYRTDIEANFASHSGGAGGGVGRTQFSGIQFRKRLDKGSVALLLACASGRHIASGQFTFRHASEDAEAFYSVKLKDVVVSHISQAVGSSDSAPTEEEVTLRCGRIQWAFSSQNPDGSHSPPITGEWDVPH